MQQDIDPIIGQCRKCQTDILESHEYVWCTVCNAPISDAVNIRRRPRSKQQKTGVSSNEAEPTIQTHSPILTSQHWISRYKDAYRVARTIDSFGGIVKLTGILSAIVIGGVGFLIGISMAASGQNLTPAGIMAGFLGLVFGFLVGALFYISGILISANGQHLMAALDSAVYASPFLSPEQKKQAMT